MPLQTLILDLGNTLVPFSFDRILAADPRLASCRAEIFALALKSETGALAPDQLRREVGKLAGIPRDSFDRWWNSIFAEDWLIPPTWVRSWMKLYRVGLLSNTNAIHFEFLRRRYPLLDELNFRVLSYEVGAVKPDEAIFAAAEAAAECQPSAILYLDDLVGYTEAAQRRGWNAVTVTSRAAVQGALAAQGIAVGAA